MDKAMQRIVNAANACLDLDKTIEQLEEAHKKFEEICEREGF